jgi:hypothetical protein
MIYVDGGTFMMGATKEQIERGHVLENEFPAHEVTLDSYYIGQTEVTNELWVAVMGYIPSRQVVKDQPVEQVTWETCQQFIKKLNEMTGLKFRLPTEAEWEFAARGGNKSAGYLYAGGIGFQRLNVFLADSFFESAYEVGHEGSIHIHVLADEGNQTVGHAHAGGIAHRVGCRIEHNGGAALGCLRLFLCLLLVGSSLHHSGATDEKDEHEC